MNKKLFRNRLCRQCRKPLHARYANQWIHARCQHAWRKRYQRRYQRKLRREFMESSEYETENQA